MAIISRVGTKAGKASGRIVCGLSKRTGTETGIPVAKYMKSGTKVISRPGIKTVIPGSETKLGKMGVAAITCYEKGYFPHSNKLIAINLYGSKSSVGLFSPKGAKDFLRQVKEIQRKLAVLKQNLCSNKPETGKKYIG